MNSGRLRVFGAALLLCLWGVQLAESAPFAAPADGPLPFRRDRVPLDQDTLTGVSAQLVVLARATSLDTAENRRAVAQMLALAAALEAEDTESRELIAALAAEKQLPHPAPAAGEVENAKVRLWQLMGWLETPDAGIDGKALAACLHDVLAFSDPTHPRAVRAGVDGEAGAWTGWVAAEDAFEEVAAAVSRPVTETEQEAASHGGLKLTAATLISPLWVKNGASGGEVLLPTELRLVVALDDGSEPSRKFEMGIPADPASQPHRQMLATLHRALATIHGDLPPAQVSILIAGDQPYLSGRNRGAVGGPAFVLASAAITGRVPAGIVIGEVGEDGGFFAPPGFWDRVRSLPLSEAGRLVVPMAAAEQLAALLALEQPEFFLSYEVLGARTLQELLELSAADVPPAVAEASVNYLDIKAKWQSKPVGHYLASPGVRQKLAELSHNAPYHLSARMLAMQGAGERPVVLPRQALAAELRRALTPMDWLAKQGRTPLTAELAAEIDATYMKCRSGIDELERYVDTSDRELFAKARDFSTLIRTLGRAFRLRAKTNSGATAVLEEQGRLVDEHQKILEHLGELAADPLPKHEKPAAE